MSYIIVQRGEPRFVHVPLALLALVGENEPLYIALPATFELYAATPSLLRDVGVRVHSDLIVDLHRLAPMDVGAFLESLLGCELEDEDEGDGEY